MKREFRFARLFTPLFLAVLLAGATLLTGCTDSLLTAEEDRAPALQSRVLQTSTTSKLRHAHLMDRARRNNAGKSGSAETVGLVINMDGIVLEADKLLRRYQMVERYKLLRRYDYDNVFFGVAAEVDVALLDSVLAEMENDPEIDWVEPDIFVEFPDIEQFIDGSMQVVPWGIDRIGGTESVTKSGDGQGQVDDADLFLLDSGTKSFDIRIGQRYTNFTDSPTPEDVFVHGVHLSGTAVAKDNTTGVVGVAPGAKIHSVKVLNDEGKTDISVAVAALDSIMAYKAQHPGRDIVVNMSFGADVGTTDYTALDEAVEAAVAAGITVVVAAGNEGIDASTVTPAHAASAITVGAYDVFNRFADFSNYGPTVDILAPGVDILSVGLDNGQLVGATMSGTSMAAAHVSGAAVLYLAYNEHASPSEVRDALMAASKATVWDQPAGTTDHTVWVGDNFPLAPGQ